MANKKPDTLYDLFHNAYLKYPNNIAVIHDCVKLKYVVLMSEIKKLSESLGQFCQNCTYIGICIKSLHLAPTVILGIMRLHKAYVVLEDEAAGRRLGWLGCAWVVAEQNCWVGRGSELHSQLQLHEVILGLWAVQGVMPLLVDGVALAYAVHTSGTTGQPKVVQVPHAAILPNITDIQHVLQLTERDVVLLAAPLTFDPSVVEMFLALSSGAAVQVVACGSPLSLLQSITVLQVTPSTLCCWLGVHGVVPAGLRVLLLGGEPCPPLAVLRRWMGGRANCRVFNVYGVTEVSCWASLQEVCWGGHAAGVPLGCPLSSTVLSVRNHAGQAVTQGEGEMYVGEFPLLLHGHYLFT